MSSPNPSEYLEHQEKFVRLVRGESIAEIIKNHSQEALDFYLSLTEEKADYAYLPEKWTVKEVLQHVIDCERIFAFRVLSFARGEKAALNPFDEDEYARQSEAGRRTLQSLKDEFKAVRLSSDLLLLSFSENQLQKTGLLSGQKVSVNAQCFSMFGHVLHHKAILEERYL